MYTFQYRINHWEYNILVALEAADLRRMKDHDPAIVALNTMSSVMVGHGLRLKDIVIQYVAPKDVPRLRELAKGEPNELLRFLHPAWQPAEDGYPSGVWKDSIDRTNTGEVGSLDPLPVSVRQVPDAE